MKKHDYIIYGIILVLLLVSTAFIYSNNDSENLWVVIEVDSEIVFQKKTSEIENEEIISVEGPLGSSIIELREGMVRMKESPCPDTLCESMGWISEAGQVIICIPNTVVIHIIAR